MLFKNSHWRFAFERNPEREARLLCINNTNPPPEETPETQETDAEWNARIDRMSPDEVMKELLRTTRANARAAVQQPTSPPTTTATQPTVEGQTQTGEAAGEQPEQETDTRKSMREKFAASIKEAKELVEKMGKIRKRMESKEFMEELQKKAPPAIVEQWRQRILLLQQEEFNATQEKMFLEGLENFWEGDTPPAQYLAEQREYLNNLPYGFAAHGEALQQAMSIQRDALGIPETQSPEEWKAINESTRIAYIDSVMRDVRMEDWLEGVMKQNESIGKKLDEETKEITSVENSVKQILEPEGIQSTTSFLSEIRKVRFYSINDYIKGMQQYWNALKSTWEQRSERQGASVAKAIGSALRPFTIWPLYGEEVSRVLDQQLDAKNDEEAKGMKDKLERDQAKWGDIFGEGGEFWAFCKSNPNKTRGILEYAADHGFIYDIDESINNKLHPLFGVNLTDICSDWRNEPNRIENYYTLLRTKNSAGRDKEIKEGHDTDVDTDNVPMFITLIQKNMRENNLWKVVGICDRAMERGLWSEISAWILTTIMSELRANPALRIHTPQIFFDLVGKLSMYKTAFSTGWLKAYRPELREWAKTGDESILDDTALSHLPVIQQDIIQKDPHTDYTTDKGRETLNHHMAQVLAGRVLKLPRGYIHIYESRFDSYRTMAEEAFQDVANPTQEDSDFATQMTEKPMLPHVSVAKILHYTSTREFSAESWVSGYFHSLVLQAKELKEIPELREAHTNFCKEVRGKMDHYFGGYITKNAPTSKEACNKQFGLMDGNTPAIASMIASNLISWDLMKNAADTSTLFEQLKQHFPEFAREKGLFKLASPRPSATGSASPTPSQTLAA